MLWALVRFIVLGCQYVILEVIQGCACLVLVETQRLYTVVLAGILNGLLRLPLVLLELHEEV